MPQQCPSTQVPRERVAATSTAMDLHDVVQKRVAGLRHMLEQISDAEKRQETSKAQTVVLKSLVSKLDVKSAKHVPFCSEVVEALCEM